MKTLKWAALAACLLAAATFTAARADDAPKTGFQNLTYKDADGKEVKYVLFVPHDYKGDKPFPLILFLHGAGETFDGKNEGKQAKQGIGPAVEKQDKTFPAFVLMPQAQKRNPGWRADGEDAQRALDILKEVQKDYKIDDKRLYLTGLSMGGFGTWSLATKYPDKWAAIVPICGGGNVKDAEKIKDIPTWVFHGDADKSVNVEKSREMIKALKDAGGNPKYDEYPGVGHNSWDKAYATKELYEWLFMQQKK
jgi:predicted peptidase